MKRREFIAGLGGAAAWPLAALAQQGTRMPRLGVVFGAAKSKLSDVFIAALTRSLSQLGWIDGNNIQIDYRWAENKAAQAQTRAKELASLKPDVVLAHSAPVVAAFQRETSSIPIVFVAISDPVALGFVATLSHPGGNITGFSNFEPTLVGKYIEILKDITPGLTAVSYMFNPDSINSRHLIGRPFLEAAARYHTVDFIPAPVRDSSDIERVISSLGDKPTEGLTVAGEPFFGTPPNLDLIVELAKSHRVPTVYSFRHFVEAGGLISYGNDLADQYRQAATYIDRILRGASPSDLPVQAPTKFEMVINLRTAKAMGLAIPPTLLARADEVIE